MTVDELIEHLTRTSDAGFVEDAIMVALGGTMGPVAFIRKVVPS